MIHHRGDSYRNIYTVSPSQSLYDDILDESEYEIAEIWEEKTSSIEYSVDKIHRPFQYGEKENSLFVFDNINPGITRFSDGNFGVWYGALEELTSLIETYYWIFKEIQPDLKNATNKTIRKHRRMYSAELDHERAIDLRPYVETFSEIIHPHDYTESCKLGRWAVENQISLFLAPSVRCLSGTCTPVFEKKAILSDKYLYDYYVTYTYNSRTIKIEKKGIFESFEIPEEWININLPKKSSEQ